MLSLVLFLLTNSKHHFIKIKDTKHCCMKENHWNLWHFLARLYCTGHIVRNEQTNDSLTVATCYIKFLQGVLKGLRIYLLIETYMKSYIANLVELLEDRKRMNVASVAAMEGNLIFRIHWIKMYCTVSVRLLTPILYHINSLVGWSFSVASNRLKSPEYFVKSRYALMCLSEHVPYQILMRERRLTLSFKWYRCSFHLFEISVMEQNFCL